MQFTKAQRKRAKLRLALAGPAGSGKTWGALMIAKGLGGRIAVIDTERGSASLYSDLVDFDTLELNPPYTPERFIEAVHAAEKAGYDVIVMDSISHEWNGSGGVLEINETLAQQPKYKGNTWAAWNETTPRHRAFVDAILQSSAHVIATMRTKTDTAQVEENGRKKVVKLGMKAEQREGMEYEYAVVFDLDHERHWANASKDRTRLFSEPHKISEDTGKRLLAWLEAGGQLAPVAEGGSTTTPPEGVIPAETLRKAVPIIAEFVELAQSKEMNRDTEILNEWNKIKSDMPLGAAVWKGLKAHEAEFRIIKAVLAPKQENVA